MNAGYFITGTDTNIGKTWSAVALMRALQLRGQIVNGMKPVAAGCEWMQGGWKNQDALLLQQYSSGAFDYRKINPYAFKKPVSPHIACGAVAVDIDVILADFRYLQSFSDLVLVEGAGGWFSPLSKSWDNAYLARALQLPVILVVGLRLGCINHARLTYQAVKQSGLQVAGWLAVKVDVNMQSCQANLDYLHACIDAPCWGVLPNMPNADFKELAKSITVVK